MAEDSKELTTNENEEKLVINFKSYLKYIFYNKRVGVLSILAYASFILGHVVHTFFNKGLLDWIRILEETQKSDPVFLRIYISSAYRSRS